MADWSPTTFLGRLSERERQGLFRLGRRRELTPGDYLLRQRDPGRDIFVVLRGRVEILMLDPAGRERRIAVRVPGEIVGEMAHVDARPRSASAAAIGRVSALHLTRGAFTLFLEGHPDAYRLIALTLADRLRAAEVRQLEMRSDVESRLAAVLCQFAVLDRDDGGSEALVVRRTQRELAELIGAATVSVHRALRKLAGHHAVRTEHRSVVILDFDRLADIAGDRSALHHLM